MRCEYRTEPTYTKETYDKVYERMLDLMPGWFIKLDDLMDEYGPFPYISEISTIVTQTGKPIDDVIHERMYEEWFEYHEDYDDDW